MPLLEEKVYTIDDIYALPEGERAELIDGHIYYMAPPNRTHQKISMELSARILEYIRSHKGKCEVYAAPFAVYLDDTTSTYVEPDISVICDPDKLDDQGCNGAPDWIIEIVSPSNSSHDYVMKLNLYADAGVREYWIVDPSRERILVYHLEQTDFSVETYTFQDSVPVKIYPDLQIDFNSLDL